MKNGKPVYWLDAGPAISYVPSGNALVWLRQRAEDARDHATSLDLLAVGDPSLPDAAPVRGDAEPVTRTGDARLPRTLPPLRGARAEAVAIDALFTSNGRSSKRLLGAEATELAVFDLANTAKYLHFACPGIAEEAGQSLSMLVLSQPERLADGNDGLLKLDDLFRHWRGRLEGCLLVVLSADRTSIGPTLRDEAPQALPLGFLFAGAASVVSSLWAVDDASTRELMVDFYQRLLAGETDRLGAFTSAKKALRSKHPDPFHWAPFVYTGSPE